MRNDISPANLDRLLARGARVRVFDVRRAHDRVEVPHPVPGAVWRDPEQVAQWAGECGDADEVIVYCVHGHQVSRSAREALRGRGIAARTLAGGVEAWCDYVAGRARG